MSVWNMPIYGTYTLDMEHAIYETCPYKDIWHQSVTSLSVVGGGRDPASLAGPVGVLEGPRGGEELVRMRSKVVSLVLRRGRV